MHGVIMRTSCDDLIETDSDFDQRGSHDAVNACIPGIAVQAVCARQTAVERMASSGANVWLYWFPSGLFERIPGFEIGRFG